MGLVTGTCFAEMGVRVHCVDTNAEKIEALKRGVIPIYEPGLEELVLKNREAGRLTFHVDLSECISEVEIVFIAVGTPAGERGEADLRSVYAVADRIGELMEQPLLVVTKSTVPVGTTFRVKEMILHKLAERGCPAEVEVANNPEFLKEGAAIKDFMSPDRVVVGVEGERAKQLMSQLYRPFLINHFRVLFMDILSSELTKYASNAMLATRISFMNELANLSEKLGADVEMIREGMGADKRIGKAFLYPGCGYGGSCFPKDVQALSYTAQQHGMRMGIIDQVHEVNERQKQRPYEKVLEHFGGNLSGKTVAVWGLSFKPETDDMRDAPSKVVINSLVAAGAEVRAFDPIAMDEAQKYLPSEVFYAADIYEAAKGADAVVLLTEWKQFRLPDWKRVKEIMRGNAIIDGRNIYVPEELRGLGFVYSGIGRV